jgi:hypothetical protein
MVELTVEDYRLILNWFELAFANKPKSVISGKDKKAFWKLTLLAEDKIEEEIKKHEDDEE